MSSIFKVLKFIYANCLHEKTNKHWYNEQTTTNDKSENSTKIFNFFLVIFFMPDSN